MGRGGTHFFKVLMGDFSDSLRIPPDFVKRIQKDITHAVLECPNGRIWNVELQKSSSGVFLQNGWREFVKHHLLEEYDLLIFGYDGNMKFRVRIYDQSACEREEVCNQKNATKTGKGVEEEDDSTQGQFILPKYYHPVKIEREDVELHTPRMDSGASNASIPQRRGLPRERNKACENAYAFKSKFPYFTKEMKKSDVVKGRLRIPTYFRRQHLTNKSTFMVLRGPDGRLWEVNYNYNPKNQRAQIVCGWGKFLKGYNIVQGEICVFELVGEGQMKVHIFRSIE